MTMTNKEFEERQHKLNEQIDALMRERAEHERQWYNEINRRLDWLRGKCFSTRGCIFMVYGELKFKKTCTEFYFNSNQLPVLMITDAGRLRIGTILNWALIQNETKEEALKTFCKEFEEIPFEEFANRVTDILEGGEA